MTERQADEDEFFYASAEKFPDFCNRFFSIQRQDIAECRPPLITESCGQFQNEFADVKLLHLGIACDHDADGVGFHAGHYPVSDIGYVTHFSGGFPDFAALLFGAEILPAVEYLGDGRNRKIDGGCNLFQGNFFALDHGNNSYANYFAYTLAQLSQLVKRCF